MKIFASWILVVFLSSGGSVKEIVIENISSRENCESIGKSIKNIYLDRMGITPARRNKYPKEFPAETLDKIINFSCDKK